MGTISSLPLKKKKNYVLAFLIIYHVGIYRHSAKLSRNKNNNLEKNNM